MELITSKDNKVVIVSSMQKENRMIFADWNVICCNLALVVKYIHLKNPLQNNLKSNNVFLIKE